MRVLALADAPPARPASSPRPVGATTRLGATRVVHVHGATIVELDP